MQQGKIKAREALEGPNLGTEAGSGITGGTGTVYKAGIVGMGDLILTRIFIDITGLDSDATLGDIIGLDGTANPCHLGAIDTSLSGTIIGGTVTCLEAPAGGEVDIDLYAANEATGVTDGAISGLTSSAVLAAGADWTINTVKAMTGGVSDGQYLYLTVGTNSTPTADTYTAGKFLIEFIGYSS